MSTWTTLIAGGPRAAERAVMVADPVRRNVWRFESTDGRLVGHRWDGQGWSAEWRAPAKSVAPSSVFAIFDGIECVVGFVDAACERVGMVRLSAPSSVAWSELPEAARAIGPLSSVVATHVRSEGTYLHLNADEAGGFTLLADEQGLNMVCRGPYLSSLVHDAQHGLVGTGETTFRYNGSFWQSLCGPTLSPATLLPGAGPVALFDTLNGRVVSKLRTDSWEPMGNAPGMSGELVPLPGEQALLCVDAAGTHVWRSDEVVAVRSLQGCAAEVSYAGPEGVIVSDAVSRAFYWLRDGGWTPLLPAMDGTRRAKALAEGSGFVFALDENNELHMAPRDGSAAWISQGRLEVADGARVRMVWDDAQELLILQPELGGTTWAFDGESLRAHGDGLGGPCAALCATPVGLYALVGQRLFLLRESWFEVDMYPVPSVVDALFFDPERGLITSGESGSFVLTAHGWQRIGDGAQGAAALTYDSPTRSLVAFSDPWEPTPTVQLFVVPVEETHPLPVAPRSTTDALGGAQPSVHA